MCCERAAALVDYVGLRKVVFSTGIDDCRNGVVGILLNRVVHGAFARRAPGAVVVHAESAAYVDEFDSEAEFR